MYQTGGRRPRSRARSTGKRKRKSPRRRNRSRRQRRVRSRRVATGRKDKMLGHLPLGEEFVVKEFPERVQARKLRGQSPLGDMPRSIAPRPKGRVQTPPRVRSLSPRYASQPQPQPEPSAEEGAPSPSPRVPKGVTPEPSKPPPIWWKNPENGERSKIREKLEKDICRELVQIIESVSKGDIDLLSLSEETPLNTMLRTVNEKVGSKGMTFLDGVIGGKEWGMEKNSQHPPGVLSGVVIDYEGEDVTRKKQIKIPGEARERAEKFLPYFEYYYRKRRPRGKKQNLKRLTGALAKTVTGCLNEAQSLCSALGWKDTSEIQSTDIDNIPKKLHKAAEALAPHLEAAPTVA